MKPIQKLKSIPDYCEAGRTRANQELADKINELIDIVNIHTQGLKVAADTESKIIEVIIGLKERIKCLEQHAD